MEKNNMNKSVIAPFSFSIRGNLARWFSWVYYPVNTTVLSEHDKSRSQVDMVVKDKCSDFEPLICSNFIRDSGVQFNVNEAYPELDVVFTDDFCLIEDDVMCERILSKIMYIGFRIFPCNVRCLSEPYEGSVYDALSEYIIDEFELIFSREISEIADVGMFVYFRKVD